MDNSLKYEELLYCLKKYAGFKFYQTHAYGGKVLVDGIMGNEKNDFIDIEDIKGKTILDLGCATGATCLWAVEQGARKVIGLDKNEKQIEIFNDLSSCMQDNVEINGYICDLKNELPLCIINLKIDTIFCFAVTQYIGYRKIWHDIPSAKVVYVMGGSDSKFTEDILSDEAFEAKFITFLPNNREDERQNRMLFKLKRKNICEHKLKDGRTFSSGTKEIICESCNKKYVIKPINYFETIPPIAANEYISYKLLMLLKYKGLDINVAGVSLLSKDAAKKIFNIEHPISVLEHVGIHSRLSIKALLKKAHENLKLPDWIYWFDRWIGRLDATGDSNLLLTIDKRIIPVDFSMAYYWAIEGKNVKVDFMDVPCMERVKKDSSDEVRKTIKSLTDEEIHKTLFDEIIYPEYIEKDILTAYFNGLILRRNIL